MTLISNGTGALASLGAAENSPRQRPKRLDSQQDHSQLFASDGTKRSGVHHCMITSETMRTVLGDLDQEIATSLTMQAARWDEISSLCKEAIDASPPTMGAGAR